jgi:hypothetical protein
MENISYGIDFMKYPFVRVGPKKEGAVKYANK